jgi:hypothetical protein
MTQEQRLAIAFALLWMMVAGHVSNLGGVVAFGIAVAVNLAWFVMSK